MRFCTSIVVLSFGLLLPWCQAQESRGQGFIFAGPGGIYRGTGATTHFGGGAEGFVAKGFALGGDIGYLAPWSHFRGGFGLLDLTAGYHFLRAKRTSPFFSAGYSLGFREGHFNAANFGAGTHIWIRPRAALRLEFRDVYQPNFRLHWLNVRFGLCFR